MNKSNSIMRIFKLMSKQLYPYFIGILLIGIIDFLFGAIMALLFKDMFDALGKDEISYEAVLTPVKTYMPFFILVIAIRPLFEYIVKKSAAITTGKIRKNLFNKLKRLPLKYYRDNHSGEVISRMTNDIAEAEKLYSMHLSQFVPLLITAIGSIVLAFNIEWRLSILVLISCSITLFVNLYFAKLLRRVSVDVQEKLANFTKRLTNLLDGMHVIRCFNIQSIILGKYYKANDNVLNKSKERVNIQAIIKGLNEIVQMMSFMGVVVFGAYLKLENLITIGAIIAIVQLQNPLIALMRTLGDFITNSQTSLAATDRLIEVLDEENEPLTYLQNNPLEKVEDCAVLFEDISFSYDKDKILNNVTLKLPNDKVYAIVGPSGGGKSTLFKLALNFYPTNEGNIIINGHALGNESIKEIRNQIAYVPQDAHLFSGTIAENISYGKLDANKHEIEEAAILANAHEFITEMKDGYDTYVGENGAQLSGGQKQRVAIARAILKNAPILLLDEATSALDSESEQLVQDALERLMKGKSTLVIAHRLSTIVHADQILVLKDGEVKEQGTHGELLTHNGIYAKLFNQQFKMS